MQFKLLTAVTTFLAASSVQAAIAPSDIVKTLETVTDLSSDTNDIAKTITNPVQIFTAVPKLIGSFKDIIGTVTNAISMLGDLPDDPKFPESGQSEICEAFTGFVKVHQNLLETIIGKEGLLSNTPFTAPIAAVLRVLENIVDKVAFTIIGTVPTCADGAKKDLQDLDETLGKTIDTYS
ncbi:uncharacterized protein NECHADRAFT_123303 [Fusarium vanettenii 77-13-4]|uniref:Cell wall galactomannoprotein n=1 Tax=Fusarium vanettenii (strain ATCC MYA-4622 / CBS 123669 / FGSC 9596 / NRRL 45880 / 77-13-4) TaxID=660122 RepID=C7YL23_FUSV7|nr:uncharacterized protein NECHADRAFT_123303 [Fusarium vanettenii 77-13-4]EEU46716.1 hypothetical protein NECHADRAFT_123303 [Fusarium vanettenii 77-13-4]